MKKWIVGYLLLFMSCYALAALAVNNANDNGFVSLPNTAKPIPVKIGLYINGITHVNETNETVQFQGTLTLQWRDPRLVYDANSAGVQQKIYVNGAAKQMLNRIWKPQIVLEKNRGKRDIGVRYLNISPEGVVTYHERFIAVVESTLDLRMFPLDQQTMTIELHPFHYSAEQVRLIPMPDYQGISQHAKLEEWNVKAVNEAVNTVKSQFSTRLVSQYTLSIRYNRKWAFYMIQVFLPMVIIVLLSFSVFWMTHNALVNRVGISVTAILTIVVFQWRIVNHLPRISYLTFVDVVMLFSYITMALTIFASIMIEFSDEHRRWVINICRWIFPAFYVLGILLLFAFLA